MVQCRVIHAVVPVVLLLELLLPPQATTNRLVTMSSPTLAAHLPRRLVRGGRAFFIVFPFESSCRLLPCPHYRRGPVGSPYRSARDDARGYPRVGPVEIPTPVSLGRLLGGRGSSRRW